MLRYTNFAYLVFFLFSPFSFSLFLNIFLRCNTFVTLRVNLTFNIREIDQIMLCFLSNVDQRKKYKN